ncbi:hypothetical protein M153_405000891 [Pseudoloma neurophilia]|uniref:Uncharacterized protein n=1 Tax=Pseudoloma neurophilia TaxID=146866 RepID=A0A0R0LXN2_9MICR|nr:hypothetical protein M153_405000891 [Pseudoloma neurophilia]
MLGTLFYLPWIILLTKNTPFLKIFSKKIKNNPPVSDSNKQVSVNLSISDPKNQYVSNSIIQRNIPLFKTTDDDDFGVVSILNVLFRLDNSFIEFIKTLRKNNDEISKILYDLYNKMKTSEKYPVLIDDEKNYLISNLEDKYPNDYTGDSLFYFLEAFISYMVDFDIDKERTYFAIQLLTEKVPSLKSYIKHKPLNMLFFKELTLNDKKLLILREEYEQNIFNSPKIIIFLFCIPIVDFDENGYSKFNRSNKNGDVYNLKGVIYRDNGHYCSFYINNEGPGVRESLVFKKDMLLLFLIYELREEKK